MNLLYICIFCAAACVDSISAVPHITVSAPVGSTVVLPCKLTDVSTQTPHVLWRTDDEVVFERSSDGTDVGEGYKERVDVPKDELHKGNCSLVLKDVRLTDDGDYRSFVLGHVDRTNTNKRKEICRVTLSVNKPKVHPDKKSAPVAKVRSDKTPAPADIIVRNMNIYAWLLSIFPVLLLFLLLGFGVRKLLKKKKVVV
ncbi:CD276 antigen homolog isoform X1 [Clarias gariepinus]|uniref:CD276 antigen homolog isoform X1 n=1 Tax=Clarias gariepinus TaxID=13013 RepID=UPI00234E2D67|nr:CD276 antigen homolog isoform X1 [Clarias gariepinus]